MAVGEAGVRIWGVLERDRARGMQTAGRRRRTGRQFNSGTAVEERPCLIEDCNNNEVCAVR
jgi:hypothetical protein